MSRNAAEEIVEEVLNQKQKRGCISGFLRNQSNDQLDVAGIDFLIFLHNGLALPLQVKTHSNKDNMEVKLQEHRRKHPCVKYVLVVDIHNRDRDGLYKDIDKTIRGMIKEAMLRPAI